jgi:DNA (cytosine-5)-methyltransferase 1
MLKATRVPKATLPVIDLFAGPGGLGEGFSAFSDPSVGFDVRLSIENDPVAVQTLTLRKFFRAFPNGEAPEDYYRYIRGEAARTALEDTPEWAIASSKTKLLTLGAMEQRLSVHRAIRKALNGASDFVLIGGPPCQAYSLVGRSRMTGAGKLARTDGSYKSDSKKLHADILERFHSDHRHTLYRSYLEILAVHQPAVFVMENVKGILSAKLKLPDGKDENTFNRILE